jgi:hypothetical protein
MVIFLCDEIIVAFRDLPQHPVEISWRAIVRMYVKFVQCGNGFLRKKRVEGRQAEACG